MEVGRSIGIMEYDQKPFHNVMECFWCKDVTGEIENDEDAQWFTKDEMKSFPWSAHGQLIWDKIKGQI